MNCNVGGIDQILRIIVGATLLAWAVMTGNPWGWLGVIPLVTGLFKFCPLYAIIGVSSCKKCEDEAASP
jgi:hypothetical protein